MSKMRMFLNRQQLASTMARPSAQVLIAVNLSMVAGVIFWQWSVFEIVFLYWVENLVVGLINVMRMILAQGEASSLAVGDRIAGRVRAHYQNQGAGLRAGQGVGQAVRVATAAMKLFMIPFFILHYGGFCYGHGVFVLAMFGDGGLMGTSGSGEPPQIADLFTNHMLLAIGLLSASHLFSFFKNYLGAGEYRRTHVMVLMMRPYGRIVALHLTILLGAFLTAIFGSPLGLLVVLVVMKTLADLALHQAERIKLGPALDGN